MAFEDPRAHVRQCTPHEWELVEPMRYQGAREQFIVPAGFITDFASVPRLTSWLIPTYGIYTPAAILHDHLCISARTEHPEATRADADGLFRRTLRELGVSAPMRWMMWAAVRAASRLSGARPKDLAQFTLIAVPAMLFVAIPAAVVQLFLIAFWLAEWTSWAIGWTLGRRRPAPALNLTT